MNRIKKSMALVLSTVLALALLAGCSSSSSSSSSAAAPAPGSSSTAAPAEGSEPAPTAAKPVVGMIAMAFGTQSFNDDVMAGLTLCKEQLGVEIFPLEVPQITDAATGLRTLISQGCNFLVVSSSDYKDGMIEVAKENPDIKFLYLAESLEGHANIMSVAYRENEGAFLAGALAGLMTKSNNVGCVMGTSEALQKRYQFGFTAGAKAVNPDCEVQSAFTNSYTDVNKGAEVSKIMYSKGADFIGTYAGAGNLGVFNSAKDAGEGKYCFGAANGQFDKMSDKILASVVKPVDQAILTIMTELINEGKFEGGTARSMGIKENGVSLLYTNNAELLNIIPADVKTKMDDIVKKVENNEISVPGTEEEFKAFTYQYK